MAQTPILGSWWSHPDSYKIFEAINRVRESPDVLACRLVAGKVTYVHRRLWPSVARLADQIAADRIAALREEHLPSVAHRVTTIPFAKWAPAEIWEAARELTEEEARYLLGPAVDFGTKVSRRGG
ncbi:MAG: hypothetical protein EXR58_04735 [Chloroflexi bacterium]|nr:hypothetical protein [Chloroflexota bacterium]